MTVNINSPLKCNKTAKCGTMLNHNRTDKVGLLACTMCNIIQQSGISYMTMMELLEPIHDRCNVSRILPHIIVSQEYSEAVVTSSNKGLRLETYALGKEA
jgi:hypothetical protein